jgi:16S rRNA (guanine(1405)-N(7))-methyltransferase
VPADQALTEAIEAVGRSAKYRAIAPETIADIVAREYETGRDAKAATARARKRLHRAVAQYLGCPDGRAIQRLETAFAAGAPEPVLLDLLGTHFSSRERLDVMRELYGAIFAVTGAPATVADLACTLNPLAFRWMGLPASTRYLAYDFNAQMVAVVARYLELEGLQGRAEQRDVLCAPLPERSDVALLLKVFDNMEARRRGAGWVAVDNANAGWIAVSFPARGMSGRPADFSGKHLPGLREGADQRGWEVVETLRFATEIVVVLRAGPCTSAERGG